MKPKNKIIVLSVLLACLIGLDLLTTYYALGGTVVYDPNAVLYETNTIGLWFNLNYAGIIISQIIIYVIICVGFVFSENYAFTIPSNLTTYLKRVRYYFFNKHWLKNYLNIFGFVFIRAQFISRSFVIFNNLLIGISANDDFPETPVNAVSNSYVEVANCVLRNTPTNIGHWVEILSTIIFVIIFLRKLSSKNT